MLKAVTLALTLGCCLAAVTIDLNQQNQYQNQTILATTCNKDTQIDLKFNSNSKLSCSGGTCSTSGLDSSTMKFMDINGNDLELTLAGAQAVSNTDLVVNNLGVAPDYYYLFRFITAEAARTVYVAVPVLLAASTNTAVIPVNQITDGTFNNFQNPSTSGTLDLSSFTYLNQADYSKFYHVTNSAKTETLLLSATVLKLSGALLSTTPIAYSFSPDYMGSGNKLCYGSNEVTGLVPLPLSLVPEPLARKLAPLDLDDLADDLLAVLPAGRGRNP